ncbi:alpha/beta fold hydrolase [Cupriavidus sp. CV2]|uniref:alpha/beta fold hydrolase n=1 Tax=Cupriavidus ulmosensis TaxID=3065913 RepID=UPI00296AD93B|nr:alpha/beta fold hydrolase [Cupriavidus sp. CV2]MDW3686582.1 alpha/beta fold hydrolase [Cupriavidus sp. CV2]
MVNHPYFGTSGRINDVTHRVLGAASHSTLVLGNSLGTDSRLWGEQAGKWAQEHRVIAFEYPGHGSPDWKGEQSMASYAERVASVLDALGVGDYLYCGLSMGGAIGMELALMHPGRLKKLVLSNTAAEFGPADFWENRAATARTNGLAALTDAILGRWFTPEFAARRPDVIDFARSMLAGVDPNGYAACCQAAAPFDFGDKLSGITQPTLVIAGTRDLATTVAQAGVLREGIPHCYYREMNTAHIANLAEGDAFALVVQEFLREP